MPPQIGRYKGRRRARQTGPLPLRPQGFRDGRRGACPSPPAVL